MNENVRKVFEMLGVEPNEKFKIENNGDTIYYIDEKLFVNKINDDVSSGTALRCLLTGEFKIIKLPKEQNKIKKKLRDLTPEEWDKWREKKCRFTRCENCIFNSASCLESESKYSWIHHKDLYSDKFLDQEIEVEE